MTAALKLSLNHETPHFLTPFLYSFPRGFLIQRCTVERGLLWFLYIPWLGRVLWLGSGFSFHAVDPRGCHIQDCYNPWEFRVSATLLSSASRWRRNEDDTGTRGVNNANRAGNSQLGENYPFLLIRRFFYGNFLLMMSGFYLGNVLEALSLRHVVLRIIDLCSSNYITLEVSVIFDLFVQFF